MWVTANWPVVVMVVMALIIFGLLIAYLFKSNAIGKAEVEVGAAGFTGKLKLQGKERQISERDFNLINLREFYADSDIGFVICKPLSEEWVIKKARLREMCEEKGFTEELIEGLWQHLSNFIEDPNENIHILTARRGTAQYIKYTPETVMAGAHIEPEVLERFLLGAQETIYDQLGILAYSKDAMKTRISLLDFFFAESQAFRGVGPNRLYVNPENTVFLLDCSAFFGRIEYNGELGDHIINNMALFQENERYFFEVLLTYIQSADKPTKVWDDLRTYLASFRVLAK